MWDERYDRPDYLFGTNPALGLIRQEHHLITKGQSLAIADGEGRNSVYLAQQGYLIDAMDSSSIGLEKAGKLAATANVHIQFNLADIYDYDWSQKSYDNVLAIFIQFAPPEKWSQIFEGMKQALREEGIIFIHGYTRKQIQYGTGGPSNIDHLYEPEMLAEAFADFEILTNEAYEAEVDDGPGHNGMSALIDFVARKPKSA